MTRMTTRMSNYHVEPVDRPKALAPEAIKSLRARTRSRASRAASSCATRSAAAIGLWLLEVTAGHDRLHLAEPDRRLRQQGQDRDARRRQARQQRTCRSPTGFPAYVPDARAYVILVDPGQQQFVAGEDTTGDGTALNVRGLYQRCPHLGCKPNPCLKNFWFECPCHGSRYDRLGIKAAGAQYGPAPRSMDRFSASVDGGGVLTLDTGKITLGPLPVAVGQPGIIPPRTPTGCI